MNTIVEEKVASYLHSWLTIDPHDCGVILMKIEELARAAGFEVGERFAHAGLAAGPEGRIAAGIVDLSLLGGGGETTEYAIRTHIAEWVRKHAPMAAR